MCFNNAYSLLNISLFNICVVISQEIEFVCQLCELSCRPFIRGSGGGGGDVKVWLLSFAK